MTDSSGKADLLLAALVDYWRDQLTGPNLPAFIEREIAAGLATAGQLTLDEVVTAEQVAATALKYASDWTIEGSIPELVGEIAERVYSQTTQVDARLGSIVDHKQIREFATSIARLPAFRRMLFTSPVTREWAVELIYRGVASAVLDGRGRVESVPGLAPILGMAEGVMNRLAPQTRELAELRIREIAERVVGYLQERSLEPDNDETLAEAALDIWDLHSDAPLSSVRDVVSRDDVEDFLVLAFEFWFRFRTTEYFRKILTEGVNYFFEKYGRSTLADLVDDLGISPADMAEEANRFAPPILELAASNGMLDQVVRRLHADFFASERVRDILLYP